MNPETLKETLADLAYISAYADDIREHMLSGEVGRTEHAILRRPNGGPFRPGPRPHAR